MNHSTCPQCHSDEVVAIDEYKTPNGFYIEIKCEKCGHIWHAEND